MYRTTVHYRPQAKFAKGNVFTGVCPSAGGGGMHEGHVWRGFAWWEHAWLGCVHARGVCMVSCHAWQGGMRGEGGACVARGACLAGKTATAAGSTHHTGMHSCLHLCFVILVYI